MRDSHQGLVAQQRHQATGAAASDEISLVDLGVFLLRQWRLILVVFLGTVLVGATIGAFKHDKYRYTATVQLGGYSTTNGRVVHTLSPAAAKARLENGILDQVLRDYAAKHKTLDPSAIKISAHTPQDSNLVLLEGMGTSKFKTAYLAVERKAVAQLASGSSDQIRNYRSKLETALAKAKLALDKLQDPQEIASSKASLKQRLSKAKAELANLGQQEALLKKKRKYLQQSISLYQKLAGHLNGYIAQAQDDGLSSSHAQTPTRAMTAMLLNNQVQQNMQQLVQVEQKLTSALPQQVAQVETNLADVKQQQATQKIAVERARLALENFTAQHKRQVAEQQIKVNNLKTRLGNARETRLVAGPMQSLKPVGMGRTTLIVLSAVLGLFLGLFAALAAGFFSSVKQAWKQAKRSRLEEEWPQEKAA